MIEYCPIFCYGNHIKPILELDDIIECTIPVVYSVNEAKQKGWKLIEDKILKYRFSKDGKAAWLCPNCVKQYETELKEAIESIINLAPTITKEQHWLYDRCCKDLYRFGATEDDFKNFYENLDKT